MKFLIKTASVTIIICIALVSIIATTSIILKNTGFFDKNKSKITSEFIGNKILEISELATLQHHYRKIANYQDAKKLVSYLPDWRINKSIKEFMIVYEGDVKLGYNLNDISINIDTTSMTIEITLPDPKILSHSVDFESISIICENKGWFNEIKFDDFKRFFSEEQKNYEKTNHQFLKKKAREQAERVITYYLHSIIKVVKPQNVDKKLDKPVSIKNKIQTWLHPEDGYKLRIK